MPKQKVTKMGSGKSHFPKSDYDGVYFWPQSRLGFVFGLFCGAKRHGKNAKRELRMIGDRAPFPRYYEQSAKRKNSAWDDWKRVGTS